MCCYPAPPYVSTDGRLIIDPYYELLSYGRFPFSELRKFPEGIVFLEGCAGAGNGVVALLLAGIPIALYIYFDTDPTATSVTRALLHRLHALFPDLLPTSAFTHFDTLCPQDAAQFAATARTTLLALPAWPHLGLFTFPCQDTSRTGLGLGLRGSRSINAIHCATIAREILRGPLNTPTPPTATTSPTACAGWMMETSPLYASDTRPYITEASHILNHIMGPPLIDDAALRGSTARRVTQLHSNLGPDAHTFTNLSNRPAVPPRLTLSQLFGPGVMVQTVQRYHDHSPPNALFQPMQVLPKFVRAYQSHQYCLDAKGEGKHGLAVIQRTTPTGPQLSLPTADEKERAMGHPIPEATRWAQPTSDPTQLVEVDALTRHQLIGNFADPSFLASTFLAIEAHEPPNAPAPPAPPPSPRAATAPAAASVPTAAATVTAQPPPPPPAAQPAAHHQQQPRHPQPTAQRPTTRSTQPAARSPQPPTARQQPTNHPQPAARGPQPAAPTPPRSAPAPLPYRDQLRTTADALRHAPPVPFLPTHPPAPTPTPLELVTTLCFNNAGYNTDAPEHAVHELRNPTPRPHSSTPFIHVPDYADLMGWEARASPASKRPTALNATERLFNTLMQAREAPAKQQKEQHLEQQHQRLDSWRRQLRTPPAAAATPAPAPTPPPPHAQRTPAPTPAPITAPTPVAAGHDTPHSDMPRTLSKSARTSAPM